MAIIMEKTNQKLVIKFHDGREEPIDVDRIIEFENRSLNDRLFQGQEEVDAKIILEELGPCVIDFANVHGWSQDIPDIHPSSARLFTIWGENTETGEVVGLIRGYFVLPPFSSSRTSTRDYYTQQERVPYYPLACISSFRTILNEREVLDEFLDQMLEAISKNWQKLRNDTIERLKKGSDLWKRFLLSFDDIIHFSFLCPSIDRGVIDALKRKDYRTTGVMQLLASASPFYDQAAKDHHLRTVQRIIDKYEKEIQVHKTSSKLIF
ncbi:MAG: hypothetical protein ACE5OZ_23930 [Candidatus Heimdallarchaeota archaeon]